MTDPSHQLPVGACGDAAPTGDLNPIAYALGVLQVEAETLRRERDTALRMLARVVDAFEDFSHDLDARMGEARRLLDRAAS